MRSLAQRSGFSPSFLSQVELGQSSPSLASLQRICEALDLDLVELLRDDDSKRTRPTPVVRKAERASVRSEWSRASAESLVPAGKDDQLSALLLSLDPGGHTGALPAGRGRRELAYCIRGQVRLTLGAETYELSAGDSVLIERAGAAWENRGRGRAEVLVMSARLG